MRTQDGHRVVIVAGVVVAHYAVGDRMAEAHAMVNLVDQGWADQKEVARAFGCSARSVRRHQRRFEEGGLPALGRRRGYPKGHPRLPAARTGQVTRLKERGFSNCQIAACMGVTETAVRKVLKRIGLTAPKPAQAHLSMGGAG
ncbi:MAG: helix-turn-helix domain-containing protein, partial [Patescibacteria group bacterium]